LLAPAFGIDWRKPLSAFKKATQASDLDTTKATARLPGLDIEIVHRRSPAGDAEQISINLQAVPSFDAFGGFLEGNNPMAFWSQAMQLAWSPWLEAARIALLPFAGSPALPKGPSDPAAPTPERPHKN
jgi:hypothetical protein